MNIPNLWLKSLTISVLILSIAACSGGSSIVEKPTTSTKVLCATTDDENTDDECGTALVGITDADGDFLTYTVNIDAIELTHRDGTVVSLLTSPQTLDFTNYVELSELMAAATIPAGVYTSGSITIDYTNADIQVEKDGVAVAVNMINEQGDALGTETLALQFDNANNLFISRARASLLEFDFNLAASHTVDINSDPVTVTTNPFVIVEVNPVDSKEFRIRGPLISVNEAESYYRIAVRPFHGKTDRIGGLNVHVTEDTNFDINGEPSMGADGLSEMALLEPRTASVAFGVYDRDDATFTASIVLAGSSVPGSEDDAARGVIIAREANTLTVKGASLIREDGTVTYQDEITVLIAETTKVRKPRRVHDEVTIDALSVGQAVMIHGVFVTDDTGTVLDATEGAVMMKLTYASGHVLLEAMPLLNVELQALSGRRTELYDFSGTGIDETFDADPDNYEVSILRPVNHLFRDNAPVRVAGFVTPFGSAPADFDALTITDYANSRSQLVIDWPEGEAVVSFSEITGESLTINLVTDIDGGLYKLIQGGIRTDLTSFDSAVVIQPFADRGSYAIKTEIGVTVYSNFMEFTTALQQQIDEGKVIDKMHAMGGFDADTKIFTALKLAIKID